MPELLSCCWCMFQLHSNHRGCISKRRYGEQNVQRIGRRSASVCCSYMLLNTTSMYNVIERFIMLHRVSGNACNAMLVQC